MNATSILPGRHDEPCLFVLYKLILRQGLIRLPRLALNFQSSQLSPLRSGGLQACIPSLALAALDSSHS